jgi:hypothetical protein
LIRVFIPNNFIPERTYAINVLLKNYCGLEVEVLTRPKQIHYEITLDDKSIIIKDQFFGKTYVGESYLSPARIPEKILPTTHPELDNIVCIYGEDKIEITDDKIICDVDLFAGTFFMLTRWEESFGLHEDMHGRFPADRAVSVQSGFILRPIVDEYGALIRKWLLRSGLILPSGSRSFTLVPTCDVDIPYYWRSRPGWSLLMRSFLRHRSFDKLKKEYATLKAVRNGQQQDPFDRFEYLMSLAEQHNTTLIFHMIGGGESLFEGFYSISDLRIISLMQSFVSRGHNIGLHPSYNAFNDPRKIDQERRAVEKYSGQHVKVSRQHYLRFAVPSTWTHLHNAYIESDSTLGYAAEPGFRCGTSIPFPVFDVHQRQQLPLVERPLLIMDVSLRFYKNFSIEESIDYCRQIIHQVKKHNGELVFLWHNSTLSEMDGWTGWSEVMEFLFKSGSE